MSQPITSQTTASKRGFQTPHQAFDASELRRVPPPMHVLADGKLSLGINIHGGGFLRHGDQAITRWRNDAVHADDGPFIYCRDLDNGEFWSLGFAPTRNDPQAYRCEFYRDRVEICRQDCGLASRLQFAILPATQTFVFRCVISNTGSTVRQLDLTSYQELVLHSATAHEAHPAFSKLFVRTEWRRDVEALFASRRPRDGRSDHPALAHFLLDRGCAAGLEFDSARHSFLGRARGLHSPHALERKAPLAGNVGTVLDPIASLRASLVLDAGQTSIVTFAVSVAEDAVGLANRKSQLHRRLERMSENWPSTAKRLVTDTRENCDNRTQPVERRDCRPEGPTNRFSNALGDFTEDGTEFQIALRRDKDGQLALPPMPWCNVIANEACGFIVSETGMASAWANNSREHRLTPWHNDPISNWPSESIYIVDESDAASREHGAHIWSATPAPVPHPGEYLVRHGFGYTVFEHSHRELKHELLAFVPRSKKCRVVRLRLTNESSATKRISVVSFHEWVLGSVKQNVRGGVESLWSEELGCMVARRKTPDAYCSPHAFSTLMTPNGDVHATWTDARSFVGAGNLSAPDALHTAGEIVELDADGNEPCAGMQAEVVIEKGQSVDVIMLLGVADDDTELSQLLNCYRQAGRVEAEWTRVKQFWGDLVGRVQIQTPSRELDLLVNGWLVYQNLSCRLWGRSAFYQGGGAFGFRDQLQDASAFMLQRPEITRRQILLHAGHQFPEGDVLHWWHPPNDLGIRTKFADDLLWLPLVACEYCLATGDQAIWDESVPFLEARSLEEDEQEALLVPQAKGDSASLLEHCCRAIDLSLSRVGANGLPLMGCGDWNDGMNRIGTEGKGQSAWMAFFLYRVLDLMIPVLQRRHEDAVVGERVSRYSIAKDRLQSALASVAWDGSWFIRAIHDDGSVIGSADSQECKIDALVQAWSVLSGGASLEKQKTAIDAADQRLVDERAGIIRLLDPPFEHATFDPGYIKSYLPGLRENGGQYTHGILWFIRALAKLGRGDRAARLLRMITPVKHSQTAEKVARFQTEPYAVAADVYSVEPHVGRGGWSWYTGSAGWMFRIATEDILGLTMKDGRFLEIRPCVQHDWKQWEIRLVLPGCESRYTIRVDNSEAQECGVRRAQLDGDPIEPNQGTAVIPLVRDGNEHFVELWM